MSNAQNENGGFASWGSVNSESCAQVLVALTSLGIDPTNDERFIKNHQGIKQRDSHPRTESSGTGTIGVGTQEGIKNLQ